MNAASRSLVPSADLTQSGGGSSVPRTLQRACAYGNQTLGDAQCPEHSRSWETGSVPDYSNIALNAAFLAAQTEGQVTMPSISEAARNEFRKLGRPINEAGFRLVKAAEQTT